MSEIDIRQRTEWLDNFTAAHRLGKYAVGGLRGLVEALYEVGNDGLAQKLTAYADTLGEAIEAMDAAVSRCIKEDFDDSQRHVGEVLKAMLENLSTATD